VKSKGGRERRIGRQESQHKKSRGQEVFGPEAAGLWGQLRGGATKTGKVKEKLGVFQLGLARKKAPKGESSAIK